MDNETLKYQDIYCFSCYPPSLKTQSYSVKGLKKKDKIYYIYWNIDFIAALDPQKDYKIDDVFIYRDDNYRHKS